jgi:hypothetical protein
LGGLPEDNAIDRLRRGFDLDQILSEYALVRQSIFAVWEERVGPSLDLKEPSARHRLQRGDSARLAHTTSAGDLRL